MPHELLRNAITEKVHIDDASLDRWLSSFKPKTLRKKQYLLQRDDVCRRIAFVEKGALCSYSIDANGGQHVIQFAFEGWWIADLYSYLTQEPSKLHIEALEDCELLLLEREDSDRLLQEVPAYETYMRLLYQNAYIALQRRIEGTLGLTAEQKYQHLLEQQPNILQRVSLQLVASYLGVTPETLSRIRKQLKP